MALLAVGAGLDFAAARRAGSALAIGLAAKLAFLPAATLALCWAFGVSGSAATVAVLFNALPASASAYVLARQMGGDAGLLAGILTVQTIAAFATMTVWLILLTG